VKCYREVWVRWWEEGRKRSLTGNWQNWHCRWCPEDRLEWEANQLPVSHIVVGLDRHSDRCWEYRWYYTD
jgi:hypothetical protein